MLSIKRGEVWWVNFEPTVGTEIKKTRPALVVNSDKIGILPIKLNTQNGELIFPKLLQLDLAKQLTIS